jgi:hypothetical protein
MSTVRDRQPPLVTEGVEFRSAAFPEWAFPPAPGTSDAFLRACRRGYALMARSRVAITGLARNLGRILPLTISRVEALAGCFADYRVVVFENDSTDDTRAVLQRWAADDGRVTVTCADLSDPVNPATRCPARAERMALYRRRCQEGVLATCSGFDFTVIIDLDILGGWSIDGIASTFGHTEWDFVGANGLVVRRRGLAVNHLQQYDTWALRFDRGLTPLSTVEAARHVPARGMPLVPVTSCFGGLGIYTMDAYATGHYATDDLEHATFHRSLIAAGRGRLFLNPSQLVVYGRRHRFGDRMVEAAVKGWSLLAGGRPPRMLFSRAEPPPQVGSPPRVRAAA